MSKKLAIKGHPTRGKEVIELLEMMGGTAVKLVAGFMESHCYYISEDTATKYISWDYIGPEEINEYVIFTLEEFLEKYPFKVGDKVEVCETGKVFTIGNMIWEDEFYIVHYCNMEDIEYYTAKELKPYKEGSNIKDKEDKLFDSIIWHLRNSVNNGKQNLSGGECEDYFREVVKKNNENKMKNVLAELLEHIKTTPKDELEREFEEIKEWSNVGPTVEEFRTFCECVNKKPIYPDNYEECVRIAKNIHGYDINIDAPAYRGEAELFIKLLICRDAYWKIAGEQMGLDKPWKPVYETLEDNTYFTIQTFNDKIDKSATSHRNAILAFPTIEMRDAFYENFKDLIESCKELL